MTEAPPPRPLTARQQAILDLLRDTKTMDTPALAQALGVRLDVTNRILDRLTERGLVVATRPTHHRNGAPPQLWRLRAAAAPYVGLPLVGSQYYRSPTPDRRTQRAFEQTLIRQVTACAGWHLLPPKRPAPQVVPTHQCWCLRTALAARATPLPVPPAGVDLVPPRCNEFVAYRDDSAVCAVLIPHPVRAGAAFWSRPPAPPTSRAGRVIPPGRLLQYALLAQTLPDHIAAVFPDADTADPYVERIEAAGLLVVVLEPGQEIAGWLAALAQRSLAGRPPGGG